MTDNERIDLPVKLPSEDESQPKTVRPFKVVGDGHPSHFKINPKIVASEKSIEEVQKASEADSEGEVVDDKKG